MAWAIYLNKGLGLSYGKVVAVLRETFGLEVSRGGLSQALARAAQKATPTYEAVVEQMRASPSVTADETGWKVGGKLGWMWVFSTPQVTVYSILYCEGLDATNYRAEQAIRPMVVTRKVWGWKSHLAWRANAKHHGDPLANPPPRFPCSRKSCV